MPFLRRKKNDIQKNRKEKKRKDDRSLCRET
jgi:hypothetical protein